MDLHAWQHLAALAQSVELRREAGDLDGARASLDRAVRNLEVLDRGVVRGAFERISKEIDTEIAKEPRRAAAIE